MQPLITLLALLSVLGTVYGKMSHVLMHSYTLMHIHVHIHARTDMNYLSLPHTHTHTHTGGDCTMHKNCNGHGSCNTASSLCECFEGYGAATDITFYRAPDCSSRTCPSGRAWADVPTSATAAHAPAECSNR